MKFCCSTTSLSIAFRPPCWMVSLCVAEYAQSDYCVVITITDIKDEKPDQQKMEQGTSS